jgi:hypothetical protein
MRHILFFLLSFVIVSCSSGQKPTKEDITKVIKATWEKAASSFNPKVTVDINDIKVGASTKSNYAQELEGIPKSSLVTSAKIDFTENSFYSNTTRKVRRIMEAWVYKDKFGEWSVMNTATTYPDK